jgi:hypothetical protein
LSREHGLKRRKIGRGGGIEQVPLLCPGGSFFILERSIYIHFAWAGSEMRGSPHYYRLHGPGFLVEYDSIQNNANHIHTVWRDLRNDWGEDLLKDHYGKSHRSHR